MGTRGGETQDMERQSLTVVVKNMIFEQLQKESYLFVQIIS